MPKKAWAYPIGSRALRSAFFTVAIMSHAFLFILLIGTAAVFIINIMKKILVISLILLLGFGIVTYFLWLNNKRANIERMTKVQEPLPKVLYATAECKNFSRDLFGSKVDIIVSNPSSVIYSAIYVTVVGVGKGENTVELKDIVFNNIEANKKYSKTVYLPHKAVSAECVLTKFE